MSNQSSLSAFIDELRRRRVFRVAAFYGGIAFVIIQIIDGTFEVMGIPAWVSRLLIILLGIGFPVAIGLAWVFDITPQGIVRTQSKTTTRQAKPLTSNRALIVITVLAIAFGIWGRWGGAGRADDLISARSIAVLPFANLSDSREDEYFSDGITEDIMAHLAKIDAILVIGRTSVMQYKGTTKRLRDIGQELGVGSLLEGSIRRAGGKVRIVAQLIDARTEKHLWAETYDREVDEAEIFALQSDVARRIAHALEAELLPEVQRSMELKPTENLEAYEWFLRGNGFLRRGSFTLAGGKSQIELAVRAYQRAIELDAVFAAAYAKLSYALTALYFFHENRRPPLAERAQRAVERALELNPDLALGHLAMGYYQNLVQRNYDAALKSFSRAQGGLQNDSQLLSEIGLVQMRQGKWEQALSNFKGAAEIDPRSPAINERLVNGYLYMRNYADAAITLKNLESLIPDDPAMYSTKVELALLELGDTEIAKSIVREATAYVDPVTVMVLGNQLINRLGYWRFGLQQENIENTIATYSTRRSKTGRQNYFFSLGQLHDLLQQPSMSEAYYDSARMWLQDQILSSPGNFTLQADLGLAYALLGEKDEAIEAGRRSITLMPISACHW